MKAITCRTDGVLQLEEVDEPVPGADDGLVDVHAASVNAADGHLIRVLVVGASGGAGTIAVQLAAAFGARDLGAAHAIDNMTTDFTAGGSRFDVILHAAGTHSPPVLDRTFALGEGADAVRHVEGGHTRGEAVINLNRS